MSIEKVSKKELIKLSDAFDAFTKMYKEAIQQEGDVERVWEQAVGGEVAIFAYWIVDKKIQKLIIDFSEND